VGPERIAAAVSVYGVRLATDQADSPHRSADGIRAEVYVACAEHERYIPRQRADMYDKASAEHHWERLFALFTRTLQPGGRV
jgi:carboxymethylenebutenolidase